MTPEEIELLLKRTEGVVPAASGQDDEATLTDDERQYRIAHLRAVLLEAHNAWVSGSEDLDRIAEKLGDGSRHREPILSLRCSAWLVDGRSNTDVLSPSALAVSDRCIWHPELLPGHPAHAWLEATPEITCSSPHWEFLRGYR